eukprot:488740_1
MSFRNRTNKLDPGIELYEDSTSESDDEYTSTNDIRCLETDYHCFSASESIIIEVSMTLSYLFMILFITCVLSSAMITSKHNYFSLSVSGIAASAISGCISFCIYQRYERRLMNNFISDYILFDKKSNSFLIYASKKADICGFFTLKNESQLLWKCSLSAVQRCEYLENINVLLIYFYDEKHENDEMIQFRGLYFVNEKWESDINSMLINCKTEWHITTLPPRLT